MVPSPIKKVSFCVPTMPPTEVSNHKTPVLAGAVVPEIIP